MRAQAAEGKRTHRKINRAAVEKSLRELSILFGKKPPDRHDNAAGKSGAGDTGNDTRDASKYSEVAE